MEKKLIVVDQAGDEYGAASEVGGLKLLLDGIYLLEEFGLAGELSLVEVFQLVLALWVG